MFKTNNKTKEEIVEGFSLRVPIPLFSSIYICSCFRYSSCRINSTAAIRGTFILELMPPKHGWALFISIVRENLGNRHESSRISVNSCPIGAAFGAFLTL